MPKIDLIARDAIPPKHGPGRDPIAVLTARETLTQAAKDGKAIKLTLNPTERESRFTSIYRQAAKQLRAAVIITTGEMRDYTTLHGKHAREAFVLYIQVTRATPPATAKAPPLDVPVPPAPGSPGDPHLLPRRPITIPQDRIEREPITGALVNR